MRVLQVRRHAATKKGPDRGHGSHLSAAGVQAARAAGARAGPFDLVLASTVPRTLETALAMGFAVDELIDTLDDLPPGVLAELGHHERWSWDAAFPRFAEIIARDGPTTRMGLRLRACWTRALESVPEDGRVLAISHGRVIETGLITCLPGGDYAAWGMPFRHLEGVELAYDDGRFELARFLRV